MSQVFGYVTERIIKALEGGRIPWEKPWDIVGHRNLVTGKLYRGLNQFLLSMRENSSHYWVTLNQAKQLGGRVKAGEKSTMVVFWTWIPVKASDAAEEGDKVDAKSKRRVRPILRYYNVFDAVQQCEGLEKHIKAEEKREFEPIDRAQEIIDGWADKPPVTHGGNRAYYVPSMDSITLPPREQFKAPEGYYATAFHELVHSTGHAKRLNRKGVTTGGALFGSEVYSQEELVAEFGAAFLCAESGIDRTIENHTAYIQGWLKALKGDSKMAVFAASQAQKAVDLILDPEDNDDETTEE